MTRKKATVISFFVSKNIGDLALSNSIETIVSKKFNEISKYDFVTTSRISREYDIKEVIEKPIAQKKYNMIKQYPIRNLCKKFVGETIAEKIFFYLNVIRNREKWEKIEGDIRDSDVVYIGGGNMVMDISPDWPVIFAHYISLAKKYNKDCHIIYVGIGPIFSQDNVEMFKKAIKKADYLSVRDTYSKQYAVEKFGLSNVVETVDPVFFSNSTEEQIKNLVIKDDNSKLEIGICVLSRECFLNDKKYNYYIKVLLDIINDLTIGNKVIKFTLFSTEYSDYESVNLLYSKCGGNDELNNIDVQYIYYTKDVEVLYNKLDFLIGGRMHSLIFAQKFLLPFVGFIWQKKLEGFAKVSNSTQRVFEIEGFDIHNLSKIIEKDLSDKESLFRMERTNKALNLKVRQGILNDSI